MRFASLLRTRNRIIGTVYRYFLKPIFFRRDPEKVHDGMTRVGVLLGKSRVGRTATSWAFGAPKNLLSQEIAGIHFPHPVGLAAGFDKNGLLVDILPRLGFGFAEIGTITGQPCAGNPKPRLWRLKKSRSLLVYYGLKNDGCDVITKRLGPPRTFGIPIGISVGKTNSPETVPTEAGIADYVKAYQAFADIGDYTTINISCPNVFGGEPFVDSTLLDKLLTAIRRVQCAKPIFIKMPPDITEQQIDGIISVARKQAITGFICSNLTKNRNNPHVLDSIVPTQGGMSGKIVEELSNQLLATLFQKTRNEFVLIGCGGVFNAHDAYKKIRLGASLIQLITGMVYQGPQLISDITLGLVHLLRRDGFQNIQEAKGIDLQ